MEVDGRRFDEDEDEDEDDELLGDDFFFDEAELLLLFAEEDLLFDVFSDAFPSFASFPSFAGDILRLNALGLLVVTLVSTSPLVLFFLPTE